MGSPVALIHYDQESGKFEVGKEASRILRQIKGPVGVAAVCGRARQGKSFILNQLLQTSSGGFQVAPTHRPCTKGLWMWSTPQKLAAADGSEYHLVSMVAELSLLRLSQPDHLVTEPSDCAEAYETISCRIAGPSGHRRHRRLRPGVWQLLVPVSAAGSTLHLAMPTHANA
jgi:hypothetical protein